MEATKEGGQRTSGSAPYVSLSHICSSTWHLLSGTLRQDIKLDEPKIGTGAAYVNVVQARYMKVAQVDIMTFIFGFQ